MDNRVLQVSCVDFLKTKFAISLSELRVDHRALILDDYFSVSTQNFFIKPTEDCATFCSPVNILLCRLKSNNIASKPKTKLFLKGKANQNHKYPAYCFKK